MKNFLQTIRFCSLLAITGLAQSCLPGECCDGPPAIIAYPSVRVVDSIGHDLLDPNRQGTYVHDSIRFKFTIDSTTFIYSPIIITASKSFDGNSVFTIYTEKVLDRKSPIRKVGIEELIIQWNSRKADTLLWNVIQGTREPNEFELDSLKLNSELQENNYRITIHH